MYTSRRKGGGGFCVQYSHAHEHHLVEVQYTVLSSSYFSRFLAQRAFFFNFSERIFLETFFWFVLNFLCIFLNVDFFTECFLVIINKSELYKKGREIVVAGGGS